MGNPGLKGKESRVNYNQLEAHWRKVAWHREDQLPFLRLPKFPQETAGVQILNL
jgi:hypothetical protein